MVGALYQSILDNPKECELLVLQLEQLKSHLTGEGSRTTIKVDKKIKSNRRT